MRKIGVAFLLFLISTAACWAVSPTNTVVVLQSVPGWVQRANGQPLNLYCDFVNQKRCYQQGIGSGSPSSFITVTRAQASSYTTNLLPTSASGFAYSTFAANTVRLGAGGNIVEEARTNQLLNNTAPVTQTTGSLANGTYTLWVNGSGTATMSAGTATGCGTSAASQGAPISFTTSGAAGTCTVTVTGSLNAFQLELGTFGTSLIVTGGSIQARAADVEVWTPSIPFGAQFLLYASETPEAPTGYATNQALVSISDGETNNRLQLTRNGSGGVAAAFYSVSGTSVTMTLAAWAQNTFDKLATSASSGAQAASFNGGALQTRNQSGVPTLNQVNVGSLWNNTVFCDCSLAAIGIGLVQPPNVALQTLTSGSAP
jgi:hypothetical protein